jgi:hypothetical protein
VTISSDALSIVCLLPIAPRYKPASCDFKMDQLHNDTTSVTVSAAYDGQKAVQLKRGHNKEAVWISSNCLRPLYHWHSSADLEA